MSKQVENYLFQEILGNGQYGQVYRGHNIKTDDVVAIKQMNIEKFKKLPKLYDFIKNEIDILSQINHPNVIKFIEILRTSNNFYLIYEYCNGGDLEHLLKKRKFLPEREAMEILKQILSAFKVLVSKNILHRDLKPGNIIFNNNTVKVADFGFCKNLEGPQQMTKTMVGSPIYMAPEILKGTYFQLGFNYSVKADLWSIGVVYFEMLFGFCPFEDSTIQRLIKQIDQKPLFFPKNINNISKHSEELLRKMLVVDPYKRVEWNTLLQMVIPDQPTIPTPVPQSPSQSYSGNLQQTPQSKNVPQNNNFIRETPLNREQTRENRHLSKEKTQIQASPMNNDSRNQRTLSVGVSQKRIESVKFERRPTQVADNTVFKSNQSGLKDYELRGVMYDRYKVMFLVTLMKACMDLSVNDGSFKVAFFILAKAKMLVFQLQQKMSRLTQNSAEQISLQRIVDDEDMKINTFYQFFQNEIKQDPVNNDSVLKYLLDLKNHLSDIQDQKKILVLMKNLIEFLSFDTFCKNNLNDFCKFDDQKYFNQLTKLTVYELKIEVFEQLDQQIKNENN